MMKQTSLPIQTTTAKSPMSAPIDPAPPSEWHSRANGERTTASSTRDEMLCGGVEGTTVRDRGRVEQQYPHGAAAGQAETTARRSNERRRPQPVAATAS